MRQFIVSDLHGNINAYNSIMSYLESINKEEDVILYINGDLIDHGQYSAKMLLDVKDRIKNGPFKIEYLAGSHELLMHQYFLDKKNNTKEYHEDWIDNGGDVTLDGLEELLDKEEQYEDVANFIGNLKIYHKFNEKIGDQNIVLVHSSSAIDIKDECDLKIKDNTNPVYFALLSKPFPNYFPFRCKIGNPKYFTIVGHTPNDSMYGVEYNKKENYLNIDGGSSSYLHGNFECDHIPLIEVKDGFLRIIVFNNNNEIINGCFFDKDDFYQYSYIEEEHCKNHLNKSLKLKKLIKNEDGVVYYDE